MPRDINGNYSLLSGYKGTTGQKILASQHNGPLEDIADAITASFPRNGTAPMLANLPMGGFKITGLGSGTAPTDGATKAQVDAASPIGIVADWAGATAPTNWLLCYGQAVSRTDYAALFAVCGTTYGAGDGSTTFNLPKCNGRTRVGRDDMGGTDAGVLSTFYGAVARILGGILGTASHSLTGPQNGTHGHTGTTSTTGSHVHGVTIPSSSATSSGSAPILGPVSGSIGVTTNAAGSHAHTFTTDNNGTGEAHPNAQPSIVFNTIIKAV